MGEVIFDKKHDLCCVQQPLCFFVLLLLCIISIFLQTFLYPDVFLKLYIIYGGAGPYGSSRLSTLAEAGSMSE